MNCFLFKSQEFRGGGGNMLQRTFDPNYPPGICSQTDWPCYGFDFSQSEAPQRRGTDYLNCGLVTRPDGDWLVVRRSVWKPNLAFGLNDVLAFRLMGVTPTKAAAVGFSPGYPDEHWEDPRAIYYDGRTWVSGTNFVWYPKFTGCHQILVEVDNEWKCLKRHDPDYGGNGPALYHSDRHNKNWVWFFHDDLPHLVYASNPLEIVRFSEDFRVDQVFKTANPSLKWVYGEIRAGSPPVLVDGEYWVFFHSSVDWCPHGTKRYYMGAYSFEPGPPFRMRRYTTKPILMGSAEDRSANDKPLVVFPCGAIIRNDRWLVTLGVNDLDCAFIRIPHSELTNGMASIVRPVNGAVLQPA